MWCTSTAGSPTTSPAANSDARAGERRTRTLIVDDDTDAARRLAELLDAKLGPATMVADGLEALARHAEDPFDVVVVEVGLPGMCGIDLLERLDPPVPTVMLTWFGSPAIRERARGAGAHSVLTRPRPPGEVLRAVEAAARSRSRPHSVKV